MKKILFEPAWKLHSFHKEIIDYPPEGYEFVVHNSLLGNIAQTAGKASMSYRLFLSIGNHVPLNLYRSYWGNLIRKTVGVDLIYACEHLILEKKPWVVDTEYVSLLAGFNSKRFTRYKKTIEKALESSYCRKIICHTNAAKRSILLNLDRAKIEPKLEVVPLTTPRKEFVKRFNSDKIKILFVGSSNILGEFTIKGGFETLEAFSLITKKYSNVELVIRSDLPKRIKEKYNNRNDIRIIDRLIPIEAMKQEFESADILLLPVHNTPYMSLLEAMSYELPVVTIDAWANSEIVENGKTGFLVPCSKNIPYYIENSIPAFGTKEFERAIRTTDPEVVQGLCDKLSLLIENAELRRNMGKAGRWEVEHGKFSIEKRNQHLKRIFDEATS